VAGFIFGFKLERIAAASARRSTPICRKQNINGRSPAHQLYRQHASAARLYQGRLVVREVGTGKIGSVSRYFDADLSNSQLMMSSVMLYQVHSSGADKNRSNSGDSNNFAPAGTSLCVVVLQTRAGGRQAAGKITMMNQPERQSLISKSRAAGANTGRRAGQFIKVDSSHSLK